MGKKAAVLLATGFEEIEAVTPVDVLRRAGVEVTVAGIEGHNPVVGAHGIAVGVDAQIGALCADDLDLVVLPGGMPGATHLARSEAVRRLVRDLAGRGRLVAAICAAPVALQAAGVLDGRRVTVYPGFEAQLTGATCTGARVERNGWLITSRGAGTAMDFALELVAALGDPERARSLRASMQVMP